MTALRRVFGGGPLLIHAIPRRCPVSLRMIATPWATCFLVVGGAIAVVTRDVYAHRSPCRHSKEAKMKEIEEAWIMQATLMGSMRSQKQACA